MEFHALIISLPTKICGCICWKATCNLSGTGSRISGFSYPLMQCWVEFREPTLGIVTETSYIHIISLKQVFQYYVSKLWYNDRLNIIPSSYCNRIPNISSPICSCLRCLRCKPNALSVMINIYSTP